MQFRDLLEAAKNPTEIFWYKRKNELFGTFNVKEQKFEIEVTKLDNIVDVYQFKFYRDSKTNMFNDMRYALTAVPTIKHAAEYVMTTLKPDVLLFASSDDSNARKSMYKVYSEELAKKFKYNSITTSKTLIDSGFSTDVIFGVYKTEDILNRLLAEI